MMVDVTVRAERPDDIPAIREINRRACREQEAKLVDTLRGNGAALLSLVATVHDRAVGHILYSPARIDGSAAQGAALGPMGVIPEFQRQGIGSKLVEAGKAFCATVATHTSWSWDTRRTTRDLDSTQPVDMA